MGGCVGVCLECVGVGGGREAVSGEGAGFWWGGIQGSTRPIECNWRGRRSFRTETGVGRQEMGVGE